MESPAKSKTIEKLLGNDYIVRASFGHIRDLDSKDLGIEVQNQFRPIYKILSKSSKHIQDLKDTMKNVDRVLLASDEDREGEAIAWHCAIVLKLNLHEENRICFHEITQTALQNAVRNPRRIDLNMVNSQQARRILDRLVGFEISPLLWNHVGKGLSAGRVQSVCLKFIIEKENDILQFQNQRYFRTLGHFKKKIIGVLNHNFSESNLVESFLQRVTNSVFTVQSIETNRIEKRPPPPYTTSSIQQDLGTRFHLPSKKIMSILQNLYETGKITYHRTDSTLLSDHIMREIKEHILTTADLGKSYHHPRVFKTKSKSAQEAHEAIRPTSISCLTLDENFDETSKKIYQMIWRRTVASQMSPYIYEQCIMTISIDQFPEKFIAKADKPIFDGYKKIYDDDIPNKDDESDEPPSTLFDNIQQGDVLTLDKIISTEKMHNPPARFSEATIIKKMEVAGIGRPSTYANILETLFHRNYIEKKNLPAQKFQGVCWTLEKKNIRQQPVEISIGGEKNKLVPTDVGKQTHLFLSQHFHNIVNEDFTSTMENQLDEIASGQAPWVDCVQTCYQSFHPTVETLSQTRRSVNSNPKRLLGVFQEKNIYVYQGKFGPVYQIGDDGDKDKKFLKLREDQQLDSVSLQDFITANQQPDFPRTITQHLDHDIQLKKGKYGFYLSYRDQNYKIKNDWDPLELTPEQAIQCLNLVTQTTTDGNEVSIVLPRKCGKYTIKNGQYGPYVQFDSIFASIPSRFDLQTMTEEDCKELIEQKKKIQKENKGKTKKILK